MTLCKWTKEDGAPPDGLYLTDPSESGSVIRISTNVMGKHAYWYYSDEYTKGLQYRVIDITEMGQKLWEELRHDFEADELFSI